MTVSAHSQYKDKLDILAALWNFKVIVLEEKCKLFFKEVQQIFIFVFAEQVQILKHISCDYLPQSYGQIIIRLQ